MVGRSGDYGKNGSGYANELADDLKAATSDALKKAASLLVSV